MITKMRKYSRVGSHEPVVFLSYFGSKWKKLFFACITLFLFCNIVFSDINIFAQSNDSGSGEIIRRVLDNGLTILVKPSSANEVVAVTAFTGMGGIYEPLNQRGLSKLMQSILIKGTTTRNAREIVFETESVGASLDAGLAGYGRGVVTLKTTLSGLDTGLKVFSDVILHPIFSDTEVAKEKELMIQQLSAAGDQPVNVAYENYLHLFYGDYPIGIKSGTIAGMIAKITREDILNWYRQVYVPNNMVITVVGKVDPERIINRFQDDFGELERGSLFQPMKANVATGDEDRQIIQTRDSQALFMILGYPAPDIFDRDYPVMEVISYILGGDMGSRLFMELRDKKGLAYNVSTGYYPSNYPGNIYAFMATAPENYQTAKNGIVAEFTKLTSELIPDDELAMAKEAIKGGFLMGHETNMDQCRILGGYELLGLGFGHDLLYSKLVERVTSEDIRRVARKYFQHYTLSVVSPGEY